MEERLFHVMMRELCEEENIKVEKLSYGWILQLTKDGKIRHITGNRFDINPEAAGEIACDKYATYEVLTSQGIPMVKHIMVFNPHRRSKWVEENGIWTDIVNTFLKYGTLVVKPNYGSEGNGVTLCHTMKEVEMAILNLFKSNGSLSICPYYNIKTEYRTFFLDGEVHLIYGKEKPYVIGDGTSTVIELIEKIDLPDKAVVKKNIEALDISYIPAVGEKFEISWKHNLSGGATPKELEKGELYDKIADLAKRTGKAMNMRFVTIDVIVTEDDEVYVMEVNSGTCATLFMESAESRYNMVKEIYRKALVAMFE